MGHRLGGRRNGVARRREGVGLKRERVGGMRENVGGRGERVVGPERRESGGLLGMMGRGWEAGEMDGREERDLILN